MYHLNVGFLLVANEDGLVSLDLNGGSQTVLVRGERHTVAVDYDIGYIITQCFSRTEYERLFVCVCCLDQTLFTGLMWSWVG